jgi:hypothetical protein
VTDLDDRSACVGDGDLYADGRFYLVSLTGKGYMLLSMMALSPKPRKIRCFLMVNTTRYRYYG